MKSKLLVIILLLATTPAIAADEPKDGSRDYTVDSQVTLIDWYFENGSFVMTFDTEVPREVMITEAVASKSSQAGDLSIKRVTLGRNQSEVRMPVDAQDGRAAVTISSNQGIENGQAVFISTGESSSDDSNPFEQTSSTAGWFGGAGLALVTVICAGWYRSRQESKKPQVAD